MRSALCAVTLAVAALSAPPVQAQTTHDFQTWTAVLTSGKLGEDSMFRSWFDGHARRGDSGTLLILRPALGIQPLKFMSLWVGYAWIPVFSDTVGADRVDEHRAWQQIIFSGRLLDKKLGLQSRTRFEQRFLPDADVGFRLRQFLRADWRFETDGQWGLALWDELFIGLNDNGVAPQGFDQNRVFFGVMFSGHPRLRIEVGYLWAALDRNDSLIHQHALTVNLFVNTSVP